MLSLDLELVEWTLSPGIGFGPGTVLIPTYGHISTSLNVSARTNGNFFLKPTFFITQLKFWLYTLLLDLYKSLFEC